MDNELKNAWPGLALIAALLALWAVTAIVDASPSDAADALEESSAHETQLKEELGLSP